MSRRGNGHAQFRTAAFRLPFRPLGCLKVARQLPDAWAIPGVDPFETVVGVRFPDANQGAEPAPRYSGKFIFLRNAW